MESFFESFFERFFERVFARFFDSLRPELDLFARCLFARARLARLRDRDRLELVLESRDELLDGLDELLLLRLLLRLLPLEAELELRELDRDDDRDLRRCCPRPRDRDLVDLFGDRDRLERDCDGFSLPSAVRRNAFSASSASLRASESAAASFSRLLTRSSAAA